MIGPAAIGVIGASQYTWANTYSVLFDGVDDTMDIENSGIEAHTKTGGRSIVCWFRCNALSTANQSLVRAQSNSTSTYGGFWAFRVFNISGSTYVLSLQRRVENGSTPSPANVVNHPTPLSANTWYMAAITTNGTGHIIYLNTTSMSRSTTAAGDWWGNCGFIGTRKGFALGNSPIAYNVPLDGYMDEVAYYNRELTQGEITTLYNGGVPLNVQSHSASTNLVSYWRNGDPSGTSAFPTITDVVGSYPLTMTNMLSSKITTTVPR